MKSGALEWLAANETAVLARLNDFLAIPSVSTKTEHRADVAGCAGWLASELRRIGLSAECVTTPGHPVVIAEWRKAPRDSPTVLIYGHYDVQPAEPLDQWDSPPFEGTARDGRLYARGSADDKGQLWIHIAALEACVATRGALPVNLVLLVEGEEEVGSPSLSGVVARERERLACDYIVISDTVMLSAEVPSILGSMRGLAYFELTARSAPADLHSGQYGGVVANAAAGLARALSSLTDSGARIAISGFYDDVQEPAPARRDELARFPFDERRFAAEVGIEGLAGENGYTVLERLWLRPTCEVNGIIGGYTGEGAKTVIPAAATAKLSFRLVPDQTPDGIERLLRAHLSGLRLPGVQLELSRLSSGDPWRAQANTAGVEAARRALKTAFAADAVIGGTGGTIPIVPELARSFDAEILLIGFGLPGENAHAPNEWLDLATFRRGARAMVALYDELSATR